MKRKRAGLGGPVMALRDASPQAMDHFTRFDQVRAERPPSFGPVPGVEAISCRCGGKYSEFLECINARVREFTFVKFVTFRTKNARARGHRENLRKPNIEAANARDRNLAVNDLDHAPKVSEGDSLELDRYSVVGSATARG